MFFSNKPPAIINKQSSQDLFGQITSMNYLILVFLLPGIYKFRL